MISLAKKRIEDVFKEVLKSVEEGRQPNVKQAMLKHGYALISAEKNKVVQSKTWEILKTKYLNDEKALQTFNDLADKKNTDKDNRLKASIEILKLKDRYPAGKLKIGAFEERDKVIE